MKPIFQTISAILALAITGPAAAQYEGEIEISENVLEAIREFNERDPGKANENVSAPPASPAENTGDDGRVNEEEIDDVVASILSDEVEDSESPKADQEEVVAAPGEPVPHGPEVRVQPLRELAGARIDASEVRINTPFAAKPLGIPSAGWKLVASSDVPAFRKNVEVSPGTWLTLSIRPHVLVPEADGQNVFHVSEPGFDPASGYTQKATISSSIASSVRQLEEDALVLGKAIAELEQILISLPRPVSVNSTDHENR